MEKVFKSYDVRGLVGSELSEELFFKTGVAFGKWLKNEGKICIGWDMRPSSEGYAKAFSDGVRTAGRDVVLLNLITTDMLYFAICKYNFTGGAMITASHNPSQYNGLKLCGPNASAIGLDSGLSEIRDMALSTDAESNPTGSTEELDCSDDWVVHSLTFAPNLKDMKVAMDAGNGMTGKILPKVLEKLPMLDVTRMYFELDGTFPNHEANPHKPDTLEDLSKMVVENNLDFGIAFDGDGDRAGFVDDKGRQVLGTDMLSLVAKKYAIENPGAPIVHEVRTSLATRELIKEWGANPVCTIAGRVQVGQKMKELNAPFAGETSGHLFFRDNYNSDSGLISALVAMQAISDSGKKLSEIIDEYRRYIMLPETNFETSKPKEQVFEEIKEAFPDAEVEMLDGITISYPDKWFNLRASNTEPLMRLNIEGKTTEDIDKMMSKIKEILV